MGHSLLVLGLIGYGFVSADTSVSLEMIKIWVLANGLLAALGYLAAGRIITPIRRLQEAALLIGRGELKEPITIKTGDEIEADPASPARASVI